MEDENTRLNEEVAAAMGFSKFGAQKKGNRESAELFHCIVRFSIVRFLHSHAAVVLICPFHCIVLPFHLVRLSSYSCPRKALQSPHSRWKDEFRGLVGTLRAQYTSGGIVEGRALCTNFRRVRRSISSRTCRHSRLMISLDSTVCPITRPLSPPLHLDMFLSGACCCLILVD